MRYVYLQREGPPIQSVLVARLHHHRSAHDASTNLVVLANIMAPGLPIHRRTFFAGGNINPAPPTNLLQMDRLKQWSGDFIDLNVGKSLAYALGIQLFLMWWRILLLPGSFGGTFWETIFLVKGCLLVVFLSFGFFS